MSDTIIDRMMKEKKLSKQEVDTILKNRPSSYLLCACGELKKVFKASGKYLAVRGSCGASHCDPNYGKKRPDHSTRMKILAKQGRLNTIKQGENRNALLNSVEFKRTVLENKGLISSSDELSSNEIIQLHSNMLSNNMKNRQQRENTIRMFFEKHNKLEMLPQDLSSLSDDELNKLFYKYKSIHHELYCASSHKLGSKRFKRKLLKNFKFNMDSITAVYTRSSYEANYIKYFEKNKIFWSYEPTKYVLDTCSYTPDFLIKFNNQFYILECKGFLLDENKYFEEKIIPLTKKVALSGIRVIFSYEPNPYKDFKQFINEHEVKIQC